MVGMAFTPERRDDRRGDRDRVEGGAVKVAALMIVRNEEDILPINLAHHLALGIDEFWIIDNGSTDGTTRTLQKLARRGVPIRWHRDDGPFSQSEMTTALARDAWRAGADWVGARAISRSVLGRRCR